MSINKLLYLLIFINFLSVKSQTHYNDLDSVRKSRIDSMLFTRIPYNADKAWQDINEGNIWVLDLSYLGRPMGEPCLTNEDMQMIESRFGFEFLYDYVEVPQMHAQLRQNEYNKIVYNYLDSVNCLNSREEIRIDLARLAFERIIVSNASNKYIKKDTFKKLRGEKLPIKRNILEADNKYRDREFKIACNMYKKVLLMDKLSELTIAYCKNSIYHCLLNQGKFDTANEFYLENKDLINRRKK